MQTDLARFHPAVAGWFHRTLGRPTEPQQLGWPSIQERRHTLIAAPTGSGKTLAAFLAAIDELVRLGLNSGLGGELGGELEDATRVLYVSPLKALSNDIQRNLELPLEGIAEELRALGLPEVGIRTMVRTGDTTPGERTAMIRRPPHILVTTPESLYILLTSEGGRRMLRTVRTVIVDEIHALVADKRGSHLALSLERLQALTEDKLVRIGLSATQRPIEEVARFLVGSSAIDGHGAPLCDIIDVGHTRELELAIQLPGAPLEAVMSGEVWEEVFAQLAELIQAHRTTLVFVNTRRMAERVARKLSGLLGEENVTSHHGSMAKEHRLAAEQRLKAGDLRALVATASLELGIDIGAVDLVCQLGSPRSISAFLQRVGRSGHGVGLLPKGRLFPASRDDLVECAALLDARRRGELDLLHIPAQPLDILAQQIVAAVACEEWCEEELLALVRRAYPFRDLTRETFIQVVRMLAEGFATGRGRRGAHIHRDGVNGRLRGRKGARLAAITSGGAIPDNADYEVVLEPENMRVGTVNEDFAIESMPGDIFQLGNTSWRILRVEPGKVRVEDAKGQPPTIPFWLGEAPGRSHELSAAVSRLREEVNERLKPNARGELQGPAAAAQWLVTEVGLGVDAAEQIAEYLAASSALLGAMPSQQTLVLERFFDEAGGMQLIVHSPFGSRLNRAWGLALRKRFCRKFNFELQAAANDDAIVLSLGVTHSFKLDDVFRYLHSTSVRHLLVQALLDAPMFNTRWRWNVTRALAVLRWRGGRKVPPQLQRMQAEDLIAVVFPDQLACFENLSGEREIPDHPLVGQTIRDCLEEAMDIDALEQLLRDIESGTKTLVAKDLSEPSPLAQEILNAKPYAFLDDAPLEERRTQAVASRRWLDPESAAGLGALDGAAIAKVRAEAWPQAETSDELHDALVLLGFLTDAEGRAAGIGGGDETDVPRDPRGWCHLLELLATDDRATVLQAGEQGPCLWVAAERLPELRALYPDAVLTPPIAAAPDHDRPWEREAALVELLRGRLDGLGPVTARALGESLELTLPEVETALLTLEGEGFVLRGTYSPGAGEEEWCERRLLARIHRYTLNRLRAEIEPVSAQDFLRFLVCWQHAEPHDRLQGTEGLAAVLQQLEGFEAAAAAWEEDILHARMDNYDPAWLDALCLSGRITWSRLTTPGLALRGRRGWAPLRATPISLLGRKSLGAWRTPMAGGEVETAELSSPARRILQHLEQFGASFFTDLSEGTRMLPAQVEGALAELAALGLVTSDSFAGLRALLIPASRRRRPLLRGRPRGNAAQGLDGAGRWAMPVPVPMEQEADGGTAQAAAPVEHVAWVLLRRYGVVFRKVVEREGALPPWRTLLQVYRRLEARGEVRGGRFVTGFAGEQFALPEAVAAMRALRRKPPTGRMVLLSAADPLNLLGIVTPGGRLPAIATNSLLLRDGLPIALREAGRPRFLVDLDPNEQWEAENALLRRKAPVPLQAFRNRMG
ncbi:MAG: DEAD/DEAH box helicase [SAR324 cluster bacterium]|nr:DEAD/DEAH box helicase [SAR324 cluster bacterium]